MGDIRANLGQFGGMIDGLRAALPDERIVLFPDEGDGAPAEIVVSLLVKPHGLERALTPEVRWVHVLGAGVDGFPFDLLQPDQVVTCSRGASSTPIAEWVVASMLTFEKQLPESWLKEPPARWNLASLGSLNGRTLGLVGVGAIGAEVARLVQPFGMRVMAVKRTPSGAPPGVELVASLPELLGRADHVVVAAPATPATHHLVDAAAFAAMKPGVHLVNIARGTLLDQDALRVALDDGTVARATLDVVDPEPLPAGHWIYEHPKVRLTPHVSWSAPGTGGRTVELFVENLRGWRADQPVVGVVDPTAGY